MRNDGNRRALEQQRHAAEELFAEDRQERALHGEDESGGEQAGENDRSGVACELRREPRRIGRERKDEQREKVRGHQRAGDENADGAEPGADPAQSRDGERAEHKDIEQIGEEEVPFEDGDESHGDEGVHDEEEVVVSLYPIGRRTDDGAVRRPAQEWMVDGPEIHGDHQRGQSGSAGNLHETRLAVAGGRSSFVIEETLEKVADEQRELGAFRLADGTERGLHVEGLHSGDVGALKETLKGLRHGES